MASFEAKIGFKRLGKRENKIIVSSRSYPKFNRKFHKNSKKFKKKKKRKYDFGSFQAKIGRKRIRNMENKNYRFVLFLPDGKKKIP